MADGSESEITEPMISYITDNAADCWKNLSRKLPLKATIAQTKTSIDAIEAANPGKLKEQCCTMLEQWVTESTDATVDHLVSCLRKIEQERIADTIEGMVHGETSEPESGPSNKRQKMESIRESILEDCLRDYYKREMSTVQGIPWIARSKMDMDRVYVNIEAKFVDNRDEAKEKELKTPDELFCNPFRSDRPCKRILLEADAGLGKTTIVKKMAFEWARNEHHNMFPKLCSFKAVFVIFLRFVNSDSKLSETIIAQMPFLETEGINSVFLTKYIRKHANSILILLDGYDEYTETSTEITSLLSLHSFMNVTTITTTRPWKATPLIDPSCTDVYGKLTGLNPENVQQYIINFFKCQDDTPDDTSNKSVVNTPSRQSLKKISDMESQGLYTYMKEHNILHLSRIPMVLLFICYLWKENVFRGDQVQEDTGSFPKTTTSVYKSIVEQIVKRYKKQNSDNETTPENIHSMFFDLGRLAIQGLTAKKNQLLFKSTDFSSTDLKNFGLKTGLLNSTTSISQLEEVELIEFLHKTMQEYFAAVFLCGIIENENPSPQDKDILDTFTKNSSLKELDLKEQVLIFMSGLSTKSCEQVFTDVLVADHYLELLEERSIVLVDLNCSIVPFSISNTNNYHRLLCACLRETINIITNEDIFKILMNSIQLLVLDKEIFNTPLPEILKGGTPHNTSDLIVCGDHEPMHLLSSNSKPLTKLKRIILFYTLINTPEITHCETCLTYLYNCISESTSSIQYITMSETILKNMPLQDPSKMFLNLEKLYQVLFSSKQLRSINMDNITNLDVLLNVMSAVLTSTEYLTKLFLVCDEEVAQQPVHQDLMMQFIGLLKTLHTSNFTILGIINTKNHLISKDMLHLKDVWQYIPNLTELFLRSNGIGDSHEQCEVVLFIQSLKNLTKLKFMDLSCNLLENALFEMADVIPNLTNIEYLNLSQYSTSLSNDMDRDQFSDRARRFILSLKHLKKLKYLHLIGNRLGNILIVMKEVIPCLPDLTYVNLSGNNCSLTTMYEIKNTVREYVPKCKCYV